TPVPRGSEISIQTNDGQIITLSKDLQHMLLQALKSVASSGEVTIGRIPEELTSTTAADILGVSRPTLMKWVREGEIDAFKVRSPLVWVHANVVASRTCLDWLFFLRREYEGTFQLPATTGILAEAIRVLRKNNPRLPGRVVTDRMGKIQQCLDEVVSESSGEEKFSGTDEGDYYVHADAIASRVNLFISITDPTVLSPPHDDETQL